MLVVLNNSEDSCQITVPVWEIGMRLDSTLENCLMTNKDGFAEFAFQIPVKDGVAELSLPAKSAVILKEV